MYAKREVQLRTYIRYRYLNPFLATYDEDIRDKIREVKKVKLMKAMRRVYKTSYRIAFRNSRKSRMKPEDVFDDLVVSAYRRDYRPRYVIAPEGTLLVIRVVFFLNGI